MTCSCTPKAHLTKSHRDTVIAVAAPVVILGLFALLARVINGPPAPAAAPPGGKPA